jgi:type IX secretion system PorP/SprF family membrane protein
MKKLKITFLFLIIFLKSGISQQDPLSSHYMFNTMTYNPGVAGTSGMICATAISRQQWVGFKGAPSTNVFNINAPVTLFGINSGVGLIIESDKTGFEKNINLAGSYSYLIDQQEFLIKPSARNGRFQPVNHLYLHLTILLFLKMMKVMLPLMQI